MGQTIANGGILLQNGQNGIFYARMTSYSKMTAFSDFENASIVFLATFPVVYGYMGPNVANGDILLKISKKVPFPTPL